MLYHRTHIAALLGTSALALSASPALAQTASAVDADSRVQDDLHDRRVTPQGEMITVTAKGLRQLDVLAGTSVLEGEELQESLAATIGETLVDLPGVSATGFAPGASRPILRGFSGERVRVLVDGLGSIDVSNTSVDHAVTIDPLTAERIEVLRGPAVMLYGSQAIGGAVNVIDKRIPRRVPQEAVHVDGLFRLDTAHDLREGGASIDAPLGGGFVAHIDGSYRKTNDMDIAGFSVAPALRSELLAEAAEEEEEGEIEEAAELREAAEQRGVLPNSATETWTVNGGLAFFEGDSNLGIGFGIYDTAYGVPGRPGAGHHHGEEGEEEEDEHEGEEEAERVTIDMRQYRADLRGELALGGGFIDRLVVRAGYSDYTHTEFEGAEVGTVFNVKGMEARAELVQADTGPLRGSIGAQYYFRDFDAFGAEAYVPKNRTDQFAVFTLQEFGDGPIQLEAAARYENTNITSQVANFERNFDNFSGALGIAYETDNAARFGVNVSRVSRAPSAEELLSNGPHIATQAFEIGDANLRKESAWGVEAFARGRVGRLDFNFAIYQNWFDDFIYLSGTGAEEDNLPVFVYLQGDAEYFGIEGQLNYTFFDSGDLALSADVRGDYIEAELSNGQALPRIPPLSLMGALEAETAAFDVRAEVQWFDSQNDVAPFETATDDFAHVNASVAWRPLRGNDSITLLAQADNIFDVNGRRHASFTKDFVPLAGRNFKLSARFSF